MLSHATLFHETSSKNSQKGHFQFVPGQSQYGVKEPLANSPGHTVLGKLAFLLWHRHHKQQWLAAAQDHQDCSRRGPDTGVEESRLKTMLDSGHASNTRQRTKYGGTGMSQGILHGREGGIEVYCASEEWKSSKEVNRQCYSRKRTKYIYINSLLYNHDKQTKKKFTQKYKFEIINSTSVSDNSFFPPLHKVQSCIVLKAIYESQRQVGRRKGCMWQGSVTLWSYKTTTELRTKG